MQPKPIQLDYARIDANNEAQTRVLQEYLRQQKLDRIRRAEHGLRFVLRWLAADTMPYEAARTIRLAALRMLQELSERRRTV